MIVRIKTNKNNGANEMNESKQMMTFKHEMFGQIRIVDNDGNPWFVAIDIAKALGYNNPAEAVRDHCKKANKISHHSKQRPPVNILIIPESDLYRLIMRSKLESAEKFQNWVTDEVLPTIRKTGSFSIHDDLETKIPDYKNALDSLTFHMAAAQLFGFNHSQAMFQTNRIVKQQFQIDTMKNLGIDSIVSPVQEKYYSATELGHKFGGLSAQKINNMMAQAGIIRASRNKKGEKVWEITEYGLNNNLALYKDSGKSHSDGTPIQHHYFYESAWYNANDLLG